MSLPFPKLTPEEAAAHIEHDSKGEVDQLYADMLGWDGMVATVASVYHHLPFSDQKQCVILAGNCGEAGAIDLLGAELRSSQGNQRSQQLLFVGNKRPNRRGYDHLWTTRRVYKDNVHLR